jgi:hypothetical protein
MCPPAGQKRGIQIKDLDDEIVEEIEAMVPRGGMASQHEAKQATDIIHEI